MSKIPAGLAAYMKAKKAGKKPSKKLIVHKKKAVGAARKTGDVLTPGDTFDLAKLKKAKKAKKTAAKKRNPIAKITNSSQLYMMKGK